MIAVSAQSKTHRRANSAAFGLGWYIWRLQRPYILMALAYMALVSPLIAAFRSEPAVVNEMVVVLVLVLFLMVGRFTRLDADLGSKNTTFPPHLLTAPVSTRSLVFWPMLYCALTMIGLWYAFAWLVMKPAHWIAPVLWPPLMLVALCAWTQALWWSPIASPAWRTLSFLVALTIVCAVGPLASTGYFGLGVPSYDTYQGLGSLDTRVYPPSAIAVGYLLITALAYPAALRGLSRARCGNVLGQRGFGAVAGRIGDAASAGIRPAKPLEPFGSVGQAQSWFEWRDNGRAMPIITFIVMLALWLMSMIPFYGSINYLRPLDLTVDPESMPHYGTIGGIEVTSSWARLAPLFLMLPLWIAAAGRARKEDSRNKDNALNTLFATRPMSSTALVVAKWTMSARSALVTWLALVPFGLIWLMTPAMDRGVEGLLQAGLDRGTPGLLGLLILKYLTPMMIARIVAVSAGLIYLTWKFQADSVFAWSSGRPWIIWTYATLLTIAIVASVEVIGVGFAVDFNESIGLGTALPPSIHQPSFSHVEIRNFLLMHALPAAIGIAAALKLVAMAAIAPVLPRRGLVTMSALRRIVVGWFAATVVVAAVAVILTPVKLAAPWLVVATVVLLMPGARIALAPIMLDSNRHR